MLYTKPKCDKFADTSDHDQHDLCQCPHSKSDLECSPAGRLRLCPKDLQVHPPDRPQCRGQVGATMFIDKQNHLEVQAPIVQSKLINGRTVMADVFISYARSEQRLVEKLSACIKHAGFTVWWDQSLNPGSHFPTEIERELTKASAVIVIWSRDSVKSTWVQNEAGDAANRQILIPIRAESIEPPYPHRLSHTLDFSSWSGGDGDNCFVELRRAITILQARTRSAFEKAAVARVEGRVYAADRLSEIVQAGGECSQHALLELSYHEFARLGDHAALPILMEYRRQATDQFVNYGIAMLISVCRLASDQRPESIAELSERGSSSDWPPHQRMLIALHEILAFGSLNEVDKFEEAWTHLAGCRADVPVGAIGHPRLSDTRNHDRAVLSILYGGEDVEVVLGRLQQPQLRGLVHQTASNCRAVRKSTHVLTRVTNLAQQRGWKHQRTVTQLRRRLRSFERALLPTAGTLFAPKRS